MPNAKSLEVSAVPDAARKARSTDPARRRFIVTLGVGGAGAVAATVGALPAAATAQATTVPTDRDAAYQESEHVRDYYRTARI
jgi:hypothetical protein